MHTAAVFAVLLAQIHRSPTPPPDAEPAPEPSPAVAAPAPAPQPRPDLAATPPVYVEGVNHLLLLTSSDPEVSAMAHGLAVRHRSALGMMFGSIAGGTALFLLGTANERCTDLYYGGRVCSPDTKLQVTGLAVAAAGNLLGLLTMPRADEYLATINAWNARHPDRPLGR